MLGEFTFLPSDWNVTAWFNSSIQASIESPWPGLDQRAGGKLLEPSVQHGSSRGRGTGDSLPYNRAAYRLGAAPLPAQLPEVSF